jgi:hypothetical protein
MLTRNLRSLIKEREQSLSSLTLAEECTRELVQAKCISLQDVDTVVAKPKVSASEIMTITSTNKAIEKEKEAPEDSELPEHLFLAMVLEDESIETNCLVKADSLQFVDLTYHSDCDSIAEETEEEEEEEEAMEENDLLLTLQEMIDKEVIDVDSRTTEGNSKMPSTPSSSLRGTKTPPLLVKSPDTISTLTTTPSKGSSKTSLRSGKRKKRELNDLQYIRCTPPRVAKKATVSRLQSEKYHKKKKRKSRSQKPMYDENIYSLKDCSQKTEESSGSDEEDFEDDEDTSAVEE